MQAVQLRTKMFRMLEKERLLFLLLLVLGTSIISARYLEDSSEDRRADHEQAEELKNESDMDDENDGKDDDEDFKNDGDDFESDDANGNNEDTDEDDSREEVVKIQPGQSDEGEQEDEDTSEDEGDEFGDEGDATDDHMIEGDEGGRSLADQEEDTENVADQGGFEDFKKTADEIARENDNIQAQIKDLEDKFDQALSSDSDKAASDPARDVRRESEIDAKMQREMYSDQSLNKASEVEMMSSKVGGEQNDENLVRQYAQVGEDANVDPDDDY